MPKGLEGFQKGHRDFRTAEDLKKMSETHKRVGVGKWMKGRKLPHIVISNKTRIVSTETRSKMSKLRWKGGLKWLEKLERLAGKKRPNNCEICGMLARICFDHDHKTDKFRGWICDRCNFALGMVKDKIEILELLIKYLQDNR